MTALAFKLLPHRLPVGTAKLEFQRAATVTRVVLATSTAKPFVLRVPHGSAPDGLRCCNERELRREVERSPDVSIFG